MKCRVIVTGLFLAFVVTARAQGDTTAWNKRPLYRQFQLGLGWLNIDYRIPLAGNTTTFSSPMNVLLAKANPAVGFSIGSASLAFRDKFIVQFAFFSFYNYNLNTDGWRAYLADKFPNYYQPEKVTASYSFDGFAPALLYRMHIKRWKIEPGIQTMVSTGVLPVQSFVFREKGSNQFVEYKIELANQVKTRMNGIGCGVVYRFKKIDKRFYFEALCRALYQHGRIKGNYRISEKPYGKPGTSENISIDMPFNDIGFSIALRVFWMR